MSREATEARALTLAAQKALAAAFPGVAFEIETGHVKTKKGPEEPILRGQVEWVNGPPVAYVQEVIYGLRVTGNWKLTCIRWYTPDWAASMADYHGARVKVSTYGYNREVALLHPASATPEGEEGLKRFRAVLDFCLGPTPQRRTNQ